MTSTARRSRRKRTSRLSQRRSRPVQDLSCQFKRIDELADSPRRPSPYALLNRCEAPAKKPSTRPHFRSTVGAVKRLSRRSLSRATRPVPAAEMARVLSSDAGVIALWNRMRDRVSLEAAVLGIAFSELLARTGRAYATEEEMQALAMDVEPTVARMIRLGLFTREEWQRGAHRRAS